jgi:DNA invertase Pin-like site-specific DNA recombinase
VHSARYIAYYRVSTQREGRPSLGLETQRKAVRDRLCAGAQLVAEYSKSKAGAEMIGQG